MMAILRSAAYGGQQALPLEDGPIELDLLREKLSDAPVIANPVNKEEFAV